MTTKTIEDISQELEETKPYNGQNSSSNNDNNNNHNSRSKNSMERYIKIYI